MTVQGIKAATNTIPFVPFRIHYPGGPAMSFSLTGRIASVTIPEDRLVRVDVALIPSIEELQPTTH